MAKSFSVHNDVISKTDKNGDLLIAKLDDTDSFFTINGISISLFRKLEAGESLDSIETFLSNEYPEHADEAKVLFKKLVGDLLNNNLIIEK